jgi:hypothetical protein
LSAIRQSSSNSVWIRYQSRPLWSVGDSTLQLHYANNKYRSA